jgi:opacity protein-like surface antigen
MNRILAAAAIAALGVPSVSLAQAPVSAANHFRGGTWMLTAELGGAAFSDFQRGQARPAAGSVDVGDFQRRVSAQTSITTGGSIAYWFSPVWGVRLAGSYAASRFSVWNEEGAQRAFDEHAPDDTAHAALGIWMANTAIVFRFPVQFGRVLPYGVAGAGVVSYQSDGSESLPPEARAHFADGRSTAPAAVFGVGAVVPLQRRDLMLSFELTNHLTRTPLQQPAEGEWFDIAGVPVQLSPDSRSSAGGVRTTSNLRLTLGLTLPVR